MMQATITKVLYSYDLKNHREEVDCIILELPNGMELRAPAGPEHMLYINEYHTQEKYNEEMEAAGRDPNSVGYMPTIKDGDKIPDEGPFRMEVPTQSDRPASVDWPTAEERAAAEESPVPVAQDGNVDPIVPWMLLPEEAIPEHVKRAMQSLKLPAELPLSQTMAIMERVLDEFSAEDWARLGVGETAPAPVVQAAPAPGVVTWEDGSPVIPSSRVPSRTVQSDEKGNPIVGHGDVDPGELVGGGDDGEGDGIGQM